MMNLRKLLTLCASKEDNIPSVEYIANKMTPVNENSLRLPRSFAHTVRHILENEEQFAANKRIESDNE